MIQLKKQFWICLVIFVFLGAGLYPAQAQVRPNQERLMAERVAFFTEQLNLSQVEAEIFWPIYNDYTSRRDMYNNESRTLIRFMSNNMENMSDSEIEEQLNKYIEIENKSHKLFLDYNMKFLEVLPESKVLKLYIAETKFKQYLIKRIGDARQERQGNRRY